MITHTRNLSSSLVITSLACLNLASANDSSYYASGNQIIPLQETVISVKKEILTIKRIEDNKVRITVDYTFHNPKEEKSLLMGFEADSPQGDIDPAPRNSEHPYIENFSVTLNGKAIPHKVSFFSLPYGDEEKQKKPYTIDELEKHLTIPKADNSNSENLSYVYHFPATFPPGETKVIHTYEYAISGAVFTSTSIDYLLTPALRWANNQIDDFTLIIDLGEFQQFHLYPSFFENLDNWTTQGRVKIAMEDVQNEMSGDTKRMMTVWQQNGSITFHAENFKPQGELSLFANRSLFRDEILDSKNLKFSLQEYPWLHDELLLKDEFTRKALENLPYARRGYVFENPKLKAFYGTQPWYTPDPDYKHHTLTDEEKEWLQELGKLKFSGE
jgi:hypothetical protein